MNNRKKQLIKYLDRKYDDFLIPKLIEWYTIVEDKRSFIVNLHYNEFFNIDWIELFNINIGKWNFKILSKNQNFNFSWVEKYPNRGWDFVSIASNNIITQKWIEKYIEKEWLWKRTFFSKIIIENYVDLNFIEHYLEKPWYWDSITKKIDNVSLDKFSDKPLDWAYLSKCDFITVELIEKYINKSWNFEYLTKLVSLEFINKYPDKKWDWKLISSNKNITLQFIEKNINKKYNWEEILKIINIDLDFALKHIQHIHNKENFISALFDIGVWDIKLFAYIRTYHNLWYKIYESPIFTKELLYKFPLVEWKWDKIIKRLDFNIKWLIGGGEGEGEGEGENKLYQVDLYDSPNFEIDWLYKCPKGFKDHNKLLHRLHQKNKLEEGLKIINEHFNRPSMKADEKYGDLILKYDQILWDIRSYFNENITKEFIEHNINFKYDYGKPYNLKLVDKFPDLNWDWGRLGLSCHPDLTIDFIVKYQHKPWCFTYNNNDLPSDFYNRFWYNYKDISLEIIYLDNPYKNKVAANKINEYEEIQEYNNRDNFSINNNDMDLELESLAVKYSGLSFHKNFNMEWVEKLPNKPWVLDYSKQSYYSFAESGSETYFKYFAFILFSKYFKINNLGDTIDWNIISCHQDFTEKYLIENIKKNNWEFDYLIEKRGFFTNETYLDIIMEYIEDKKHINCLMKYNSIFKTPKCLDLIEKYLNKNWNWKLIIEMDFIHPEFLIKHLDKLENKLQFLISLPDFDIDWLDKYSLNVYQERRDLFKLIYCKNFNINWVKKYPKLPWIPTRQMMFSYQLNNIFNTTLRQYMAIYKIKQWWKKIYYSPHTDIGYKRLYKSLDQFYNI